MTRLICFLFLFFFNDTATTEIYTLSLHDALPISSGKGPDILIGAHDWLGQLVVNGLIEPVDLGRSEEHTSELQSRPHLVCRLLLEKKKKKMSVVSITAVIYFSCLSPS